MTRGTTLNTSPESTSSYDGLHVLKLSATVESSHLLLNWSWVNWENGVEDTMGMPSWDELGRVSGWEKRSAVDRACPDLNAANAVATSAIDPIVVSSTLISHAPHIQACQSYIRAVRVLSSYQISTLSVDKN